MADRWLAKKAGEMAQDAMGKFLGIDDKDKDKEESFFSRVFNRDDDDDKKQEDGDDKDGLFSKIFDRDNDEEKKRKMREMERKKEEEKDEKDGFFSKLFDKDDDRKEKKSGFSGLFSELEGVDASGEDEAAGCPGGQMVLPNDGDLLNDLMDVANETAKE